MSQAEIVKLKKIKLVGGIDGSTIPIAIQVTPHDTNKGYIERTITFYPDDTTMVTEREAQWLLHKQKYYRFAEVFED